MIWLSLSRASRGPALGSQGGAGLIHVLFLLVSSTAMILVSVSLMEPAETPAATAKTIAALDRLKEASSRYQENVGSPPPNLDALLVPAGAPCAPDTVPSSPTFRQLRGWCGPYLDQEISGSDLFKRDGWGTLLQYNGNTIVSCGPNRVCGDGDDLSIAL
jgi:hypothetical protein